VKADLSFVAGAMPGGDAVAKKSFFFSARRQCQAAFAKPRELA